MTRALKILKNFEAFLLFETETKRKILPLVFLGVIIPGEIRYLFIFLLITKLLPLNVNAGSLKLLLSLRFSRAELMIFSYIFGFLMVSSATVIGESFFFGKVDPMIFFENFIFYSAYFGILMLVTLKGADSIIFPVFLLIADLIGGGYGDATTNFYKLISPLYHKNLIYSTVLSVALLLISFFVFIYDRKEKW